jgi:hypothetical protein
MGQRVKQSNKKMLTTKFTPPNGLRRTRVNRVKRKSKSLTKVAKYNTNVSKENKTTTTQKLKDPRPSAHRPRHHYWTGGGT